MKLKKHSPLQSHLTQGFSLVEIMVAVGLLGAISLWVANLVTSANKSAKNVEQRTNIVYLHNSIYQLLSNEDSCSRTFGDAATGIGAVSDANGWTYVMNGGNIIGANKDQAITTLRNAAGVAQYTTYTAATPNLYETGTLRIATMTLSNYQTDDAAPDANDNKYRSGTMRLRIVYEKVVKSVSTDQITKDLTLQVKLKRTGETHKGNVVPASEEKFIKTCTSMAGLGSNGFWLPTADAQGIFYMNRVGIGTSNPEVTSRLHLSGPSTTTLLIDESTSTASGFMTTSTVAPVGTRLGTSTAHPLTLYSGNTPRWRINANGGLQNLNPGAFTPLIIDRINSAGLEINDSTGSAGDGITIRGNGSGAAWTAPLIRSINTANGREFLFGTRGDTFAISSEAPPSSAVRLTINHDTGLTTLFSETRVQAALRITPDAASNGTTLAHGGANLFINPDSGSVYVQSNTGRSLQLGAGAWSDPGASGGSIVTQADRLYVVGSGSPRLVHLFDNATVAQDLRVERDISTGRDINATGTVTGSSDETLKEKITPIENPLKKILALKGVSFYWKDRRISEEKQIGLIAQNVEKSFPELVKTNENTGLKSVAYQNLVAPLIEAFKDLYKTLTEFIKSQNRENKQLRNEIQELKLENERLSKEIREIRQLLRNEHKINKVKEK